MTNVIEADVLIIGGGPAGCACALYAARSALKTIVLDKNPAVGALAITHKIANYPGISADTTGSDLLEVMRDQAVAYGAKYQQVQVYGIDVSGPLKLVYTPVGLFQCKALVLAQGPWAARQCFLVKMNFWGVVSVIALLVMGLFIEIRMLLFMERIKRQLTKRWCYRNCLDRLLGNKCKAKLFRFGGSVSESAPNVNRLSRTRLLSIEGDTQVSRVSCFRS